jgi:prepilin-type N-terminal cleavage/methylation domain-containing protein
MRPVPFRGQDGFTLVELMVAMSIFLLILVGIF